MANPRQRRKAKSSTHRAISHSKRAKRLQKKMPAIRGPKALQDAWDSSRTLRQNYSAMGLAHDLNPISSGGSEVNLSRTIAQTSASQLHPTTVSSTIDGVRPVAEPTAASALPKGFGRIIRDSSGNVVSVELQNEEEEGYALKTDPAIDRPVVPTRSELRIWAYDPELRKGANPADMGNAIVQDLEDLAASGKACERHTSSGERLYLERLVKKYGDDLSKMARDRRLNPDQRTANELRRAIAKAGGYGTLCKDTATKVAE